MKEFLKNCSICKILKEEDLFYKNRSMPDNLQSYCIECSKERSKVRYKEFSPEQKKLMRDKQYVQIQLNRQFVWDYLKNHPCIDCKESDPVVLEFDHLRDKIKPISNLVSNGVSLKCIREEIDKCEVRCANCHRRKTAIQFGWYKNIVL